jgi:hypothetical protein
VLEVTSIMGFERYRRFYFREIEALIFLRTKHRAAWNWFLAGATALLLSLAGVLYASYRSGETQVALGFAVASAFCAGLTLAGILWNTWLGETCACFAQTQTGISPLRGLRRLRTAQRVQERLSALIAVAQATPPSLPGESAAGAPDEPAV